jgi:hypothetical protein
MLESPADEVPNHQANMTAKDDDIYRGGKHSERIVKRKVEQVEVGKRVQNAHLRLRTELSWLSWH